MKKFLLSLMLVAPLACKMIGYWPNNGYPRINFKDEQGIVDSEYLKSGSTDYSGNIYRCANEEIICYIINGHDKKDTHCKFK